MIQEAESLPASFKAALMGEIEFHRTQENGRLYHARVGGPVSPFIDAINQHRERYAKKLAQLKSVGTPVATLEYVENKIDEIRVQEINRIIAAGKIEFA